MKFHLALVLVITVAGVVRGATPAISSVENNYSLLPPGLPNYGIAQGSIFRITGDGFADSSTEIQTVPLSTTLNGVSVTVTVSGTTTSAILYLVTPVVIIALLPSTTPVGKGSITVTSAGQASLPAPIVVVQSAFGILTLNRAGTGPASAYDAAFVPLRFDHAANPGDVINLWGSGLGPVTGDETQVQVEQDLSNLPIEVEVGGVPAEVIYHGRSLAPGLDQLQVTIPQSAPAGCYVSMAVITGGIVSNFVTIPVAESGRVCSDPISGMTSDEIETLASKENFVLGQIVIGKTLTALRSAPPLVLTQDTDSLTGTFQRVTWDQFNMTQGVPSVGSCIVETSLASTLATTTPYLDAGPALYLNLTTQIPRDAAGIYFLQTNGNDLVNMVSVIPDVTATLTVGEDTGGTDIGAFSASVTLMQNLTTMSDGIASRATGILLDWAGADLNGYIVIIGSVGNNLGTGVEPRFTCTALAGDQHFAVPVSIVRALPASFVQTVTLTVSSYAARQTFQASGLDLGFLDAYFARSFPLVVNTILQETGR